MSPLKIEAFNPEKGWIEIGKVGPKDQPGTISDNTPKTRDIYFLRCLPDNSASEIRKLLFGVDIELGNARIVNLDNIRNAILITKLKYGDKPYEMEVKTDVASPTSRKLRFTHINSPEQK